MIVVEDAEGSLGVGVRAKTGADDAELLGLVEVVEVIIGIGLDTSSSFSFKIVFSRRVGVGDKLTAIVDVNVVGDLIALVGPTIISDKGDGDDENVKGVKLGGLFGFVVASGEGKLTSGKANRSGSGLLGLLDDGVVAL